MTACFSCIYMIVYYILLAMVGVISDLGIIAPIYFAYITERKYSKLFSKNFLGNTYFSEHKYKSFKGDSIMTM